MKLSLSEIRSNAMEFAAEWRDAKSERSEAQSFWNDFFRVFGIKRRSVASFEEKVKSLTGSLDRAVDRCYRPQPFDSERKRVEFLFDLYQQLTAPLIDTPKKKRGRRRG